MSNEQKSVLELSIPDLIDRMKGNRICLPSFQRDFVWRPDQMARLLESVVRHYPIGTMMLLDAKGNDGLGKLSFVGTQSNAFSPRQYVIDGQQRLRTFLDLLSGDGRFKPKAPIQYKGANYKIFYRVRVPLASISFDVDKATFIVPRKTEPHEADDYERQGREGLIPIEFLFDQELSRMWVQNALPRHKRAGRERVLRGIREVRDRIRSYSCPAEIIKMQLKAVHHANMFRLLNEGGTDLTTFDLLVARLNPYDIDLRALWKQSCRDMRALEQFKVDPIYILKTMLLIRQSHDGNPTCTMEEVKRIHKQYRDELSPRKSFENDWHRASRFIEKAIDDLKNDFGVANSKYLPYSPMLIPLAAAKWHVSTYDRKFQGRSKRRLRRWYWGAIFTKAYEKSTDTRIGDHFAALLEWLAPGRRSNIPTAINFKMTRGELEQAIDRIKSTADAIYKAILCMPLAQGATDLFSDDYLRSGAKLHDHHIFPKAFLHALAANHEDGEEILEKINHPVNRMLITDKTNLEIGDKSPHRYLRELDHRILRRYFLSAQIAGNKVDFLKFFRQRKALIVSFAYRNLVN